MYNINMIAKLFKTFLQVLIPVIILFGVIYLIDTQFNLGLINRVFSMFENQNSSNVIQSTIKLQVRSRVENLIVLDSSADLTIISNKEIEIMDKDRMELNFVEVIGSERYYVLTINRIGVGTVTLPVSFKDKNEGREELVFKITREQYSLPFGLKEIEDWKNSTYTIQGDNLIAKVNKKYKLVEDYEPKDLIDLNKDKLLYTNSEGILLREEAGDSLTLMMRDLKKETGKIVVIASGYRSYLGQFKQYVGWARQLGIEEADNVSARPGYSEHTLGTAIDFMSQDSGFEFTNEFDKTIAGQWLKKNSYKYGYIQSYPEAKKEETGYNYEAWHYRYIGIENAKKVLYSGLTLNQWLDIEE